MYTLLKLCAEKIKSCALKADVKQLWQKLAHVRATQDKNVIGMQVTGNNVDVKQIFEKLFPVLAEELPGIMTTRIQELFFAVMRFRL